MPWHDPEPVQEPDDDPVGHPRPDVNDPHPDGAGHDEPLTPM